MVAGETPIDDHDHGGAPTVAAQPRLTRRSLLVALGALGGAGVVLGALGAMELTGDDDAQPFTPPSTGDFSLQGRANDLSVIVIVIGAGVAGLCCAYELGKAGYRVTLVDARTKVGGRSLTVRGGDEITDVNGAVQQCEFADGRWLNAGPARIAQHHTTMSYCRELGVPVEVFVNMNTDAFVAGRGTVRRRRSVQADLDGYVSELLVKALGTDALDADVSVSESTLLIEYLQQMGALGRPDRGWVEVPGVGDQAGLVGEPDSLTVLLQLGFGQQLHFERDFDQAAPMFHPIGGMDTIATALLDACDATVHLGRVVTSTKQTTDGVEIVMTDASGREERLTADLGICTLPPHLAAQLDSDFALTVRSALTQPQVVTTGKIGLEYDRRFWETDDRIFGGITNCDPSIRNIWYPSTGYLGDGGVLVGAYPFPPQADRFSRLSHDERLELALTAGSPIHGDAYRDELKSAVSIDWTTQPHSLGGWSIWGEFGTAYERLLQGDGRWWFAGDWLARTAGWQHGAFESARRTVTDLHRFALSATG